MNVVTRAIYLLERNTQRWWDDGTGVQSVKKLNSGEILIAVRGGHDVKCGLLVCDVL